MPNETTIDPYLLASEAVAQIITDEFAAEQIAPIHDQIHESLGTDRVTVGIAPAAETLDARNATVNVYTIEIRFFDLWDKEIDPEQTVNPRKITMYGNRLKRAIEQAQFQSDANVWYFRWVRTDYPNDPTGNKTRFIMRIEALGDNTSLIETRA
jgi:hypothetical protein